jgi:cell fate (sporulation/competence/biofilm development) regulator YlbF (YheA/YmcA/DUF963 family)
MSGEIEDNVRVHKVYEPDLVQLQETLSTVYHFCISYDLFNQYKNLSNTVTPSPLTKQVKRMQNRIASYLEDTEDVEETKANVS